MKEYLGDGLHADFDGEQIRLYAERTTGTHEVFLDSQVSTALLTFMERAYKIKITIEHLNSASGEAAQLMSQCEELIK
jgi:hypothetical protein